MRARRGRLIALRRSCAGVGGATTTVACGVRSHVRHRATAYRGRRAVGQRDATGRRGCTWDRRCPARRIGRCARRFGSRRRACGAFSGWPLSRCKGATDAACRALQIGRARCRIDSGRRTRRAGSPGLHDFRVGEGLARARRSPGRFRRCVRRSRNGLLVARAVDTRFARRRRAGRFAVAIGRRRAEMDRGRSRIGG